MKTWDELKWWGSGERQVIEERLYDEGDNITPPSSDYTLAFDACPYDQVKVAIVGQDPYPTAGFATGIAFDIDDQQTKFPPTLLNIFKEYSSDLGLPFPTSGSLLPWCKQGVFLYNAIPTCYVNRPASHRDWPEWPYLTREVVDALVCKENVVVVSCGTLAKSFCDSVPAGRLIAVSHPSPLAAYRGNRPFLGSRLFSEVNRKLVELGQDPIDWRLPHGTDVADVREAFQGEADSLDKGSDRGAPLPRILPAGRMD